MNFNIFCSALLLATGVAAQERPTLTDDLLPNKPEMVMQYFPASQQGFYYATFQLKPDEFLSRLDRFKKSAYQKAKGSKLVMGDADAYGIMLLGNYMMNYGVDSAKQEQYYKVMRGAEENTSQEEMERLQAAMYTKKMSAADSVKLQRLTQQKLDYNNVELFKRSGTVRRVMENQINFQLYTKHEQELRNGGNEFLLKMAIVKQFTNKQFIIDHFAFDAVETAMSRTKDTMEVKKVYDVLVPEIKDPYYVNRLRKAYSNFVTYADGNPAPDFTYNDVNGKPVSLSELKGKYVYIDLWATWCGPCKAEIPALTKIEERLNEKMHFVSISLDKVASYNAWKSYVIDNKLKGIQLMVDKDFQSGFIESFNVTFIPRFILIDPKGRIKDGDAKRPSDPELVKELEALLAAGGN